MSEIRLIDANALKAKIQSKYDNDDAEFDRGYNIGLQAAVDLIDSAPTVTPDMAQVLAYESGKASADRPTGKWKYHRATDCFLPYMECNRCHTEYMLDRLSPSEFKKVNHFCSNCGADMKMKKESENE